MTSSVETLSCRACRAYTLLEVLVAASLSLMLLGLLFYFLVPTMRISERGNVRVSLQVQGMLALDRMAADLRQSALTAVSIRASAPVTLGVVRLRRVSGLGQLTWENQLVMYTLQGGRLVRKVCPSTPPLLTLTGEGPVRLDPSALLGLAAGSCSGDRILASDVTRFDVTSTTGVSSPSDPLILSLRLERCVAGRKEPEVLDLAREASMRQMP